MLSLFYPIGLIIDIEVQSGGEKTLTMSPFLKENHLDGISCSLHWATQQRLLSGQPFKITSVLYRNPPKM